MLPKIQKKTIYSYFLVIFYLNGHDLVPSKTFSRNKMAHADELG